MKPVYLGGVRGHQSVVYRPGTGWSGEETRRHLWPPRPAARTAPVAYCMTVSRRGRPGLKTKVAIVAVMAILAVLLTLILTGGAQS